MVKVTYNSEVIATVDGGYRAILPCQDKKMVSDLTIEVPELQSAEVKSTEETQDITPGTGYGGFDKITVKPLNLQEKTATGNGDVLADSDYDGLKKVVVNVAETPSFDGTVNIAENKVALSGTWQIDATKLISTSIITEADVNFSLDEPGGSGDSFSKITWSSGILTYTKSSGDSYAVFTYYNYANNGTTWVYDGITGEPSILKFGDTAQEVSKAFYEWFTSVASEYEEDHSGGYGQ